MREGYRIQVRNNKISFDVVLEHRITVLTGPSATGKTSLLNLIANFEDYGRQSGVKLISEKPCYVIRNNIRWYERISGIQEGIIFIQDGLSFIHSCEFAELIENSQNYFVIVTREPLAQIHSTKDSAIGIREAKREGNCVYNESYKIHHK